MPDALTKDVTPALNPIELVGGMAAKPVVEKIVAPIVGNGTFVSGAVKLAAAIAVQKYLKGSLGNAAAVAFGADGAEDLVIAIGGMKGIGPAGPTQEGAF